MSFREELRAITKSHTREHLFKNQYPKIAEYVKNQIRLEARTGFDTKIEVGQLFSEMYHLTFSRSIQENMRTCGFRYPTEDELKDLTVFLYDFLKELGLDVIYGDQNYKPVANTLHVSWL